MPHYPLNKASTALTQRARLSASSAASHVSTELLGGQCEPGNIEDVPHQLPLDVDVQLWIWVEAVARRNTYVQWREGVREGKRGIEEGGEESESLMQSHYKNSKQSNCKQKAEITAMSLTPTQRQENNYTHTSEICWPLGSKASGRCPASHQTQTVHDRTIWGQEQRSYVP